MSRELASQIGPAELGTLRGPSQIGLVEPGSLGGSSQNGLIELGSLGGPLQNGLVEPGSLTGQDTGPGRLGLGGLAKAGTLLTLGTVGTVAALSLPLLAGPRLFRLSRGGSGTEEPQGEQAQTLGGAAVEGVRGAARRVNAIRTTEFPGGTHDDVDAASGGFFGKGSVWRPRS